MRTRSLLLLIVIALIAAFAALNWGAFTAPTRLSLGALDFDAPLGVLMLAAIGVVTLAFALYLAAWQGTALADARRHTKEMQAQRALAEQAEASRFTELRAVIHDEIERLAERLEKSQQALRVEFGESANSLAAVIGEIDDRSRRSGRDSP